MLKQILIVTSSLVLLSSKSFAHENQALQQKLEAIVHSKEAKVGIAIQGNLNQRVFSVNGDKPFPMQSVFKFHIALAILAEVDKGNLSLNQKVTIEKNELLPGLWSPIRENFPEGTKLTVAELIKYTVSLSDNVGCDVLLRLLGKPQRVEQYLHDVGFEDIEVKINEETMQANWESQFLNWTTPIESNNILLEFFENKNELLSRESHAFLWQVMLETKTGKNRLKGQLPDGTAVAHKTGWSGKNKETGITAAVNNIGIVFLPDNNYFIISVFVSASREDFESNEKIISDISKAAWDFYRNKEGVSAPEEKI